MEGLRERFDIRITDAGLVIRDDQGVSLTFSATEALMLLDILREEEEWLRSAAGDASPLPGGRSG